MMCETRVVSHISISFPLLISIIAQLPHIRHHLSGLLLLGKVHAPATNSLLGTLQIVLQVNPLVDVLRPMPPAFDVIAGNSVTACVIMLPLPYSLQCLLRRRGAGRAGRALPKSGGIGRHLQPVPFHRFSCAWVLRTTVLTFLKILRPLATLFAVMFRRSFGGKA